MTKPNKSVASEGKHLFSGLLDILSFRSKRMSISLIVFGMTCYLVRSGHLSDVAYSAVVPLLALHFWISHKEGQTANNNQALPTVSEAVSEVVSTVRGQI
jgi:hypothetical protein